MYKEYHGRIRSFTKCLGNQLEEKHMSTFTIMVLVCLIAFLCEWIDSALGMGYGTILSPVLILMDFPVLEVVPAILLTQAFGGLSAAYSHHRCNNVQFSMDSAGFSKDLVTVFWITSFGVVASVFAVLVAINFISKQVLTTYIGFLVLIIGFLLLIGFTFKYSVSRMVLVGIVSAFNKGLSGGGFGPLVTGGQMILGNEQKRAVGCTTFAEAPICIVGFLTYWWTKGIPNWNLVIALGIGSVVAGPLGAYTTMKLGQRERLKVTVAILLMILGSLTLLKVFGYIAVPVSM
jgi:uncharacterized membrane protein YfcA